MRRRSFLALAGMAFSPSGCRRLEHLGIPLAVHQPGLVEGHRLRDGTPLPTPTRELRTGVAILGSGVAGLTAAWRLARDGHDDFLLLDGPEPDGNAAGGRFDSPSGPLLHPCGAHYLPLPSMESRGVRELLFELGVIEAEPFSEHPRFSETALVHAPDERLFFDGAWHEGLLPTEQVKAEDAGQHRRFLAEMADLTRRRGRDGRRLFCVPKALSSMDAEWRQLDALPFRDWLVARGYSAPSLHIWLDYVCRDEYGAGPEHVSAWAGLHYFAGRGGHAANAADGTVLTWPEGLAFLTRGMRARVPVARQQTGHALRVDETREGVRILCQDAAGAFLVHARRAICAMPLHVAARVVPHLRDYGFDPARHLPAQAPWLVANFLLDGFPAEPPDAPLAWDNVIHGSPGLGWVVSTHQWLRAAKPAHTVFTAYRALADQAPAEARRQLLTLTGDELLELAAVDLKQAYGAFELWRRTRAVHITVRGHGMAIPGCGSLTNPGLTALQAADGRLLFAHADLSGYSVFEEASWWGERAARLAANS
ncbi:NAD(P)-binding protein [Zoogloea sp.]|uniref:NAD(P)-binding protein n=1 Tax=Zoogloea sp. TaxID=49181 RepID=UPI0035ADE307